MGSTILGHTARVWSVKQSILCKLTRHRILYRYVRKFKVPYTE